MEGNGVLSWATLSPHTWSGAQNSLQPQIHQDTTLSPFQCKRNGLEIAQFGLSRKASRGEKMGLKEQRAEVS